MDAAGHVLLETHLLYARNSTNGTSSSDSTTTSQPASYKIIGIILAVCSGLFIGTSFVIKKIGLLKANEKYHEAAGEGYGYLKNAWWWLGMSTMIVGEICNFVAYAFVDAILVTPFGALSVVITTILSAIFLKERLSFVGKVGCFLCVVGAVIIAINAPSQSSAADIQQMQHFVIAPGFLTYAGVIILGALFTALWIGPRYGKKSMFVYITICSVIGGLSVVATQGLGAAIVAQISGTNTHQFEQWFLYVLLVFVICTLLTEIIYLNKALNLFNAALVTPTYYVMFTTATIITSAILFRGFKGTASSITTLVMGFLVICCGVVLLQLAKSSKDVPDTAIFSGDLDQMRTIAEQEEPESEPRADTIRGGAAIVRAISKRRTQRQLDEVKTLNSEHMDSINEDEPVYFDGIRRRRTVRAPGQTSIRRQKTVHPPLGMSHFPEDHHDDGRSDVGSVETDVHPGFNFSKFMGRRKSAASKTQSNNASDHEAQTEMKDLESGGTMKSQSTVDSSISTKDHYVGLPPGLQPIHHSSDGASDFEQDTSYKGQHIGFVGIEQVPSNSSSLMPPRPPPHTSSAGTGVAKRTFSFQNPLKGFRRHNHEAISTDDDLEDADAASLISEDRRPLSRGAFSYTTGGNNSRQASYTRPFTPSDPHNLQQVSEEERLGLVKGDSASPPPASASASRYSSVNSDDEWVVPSGRSESPEDMMAGDLGRAVMNAGYIGGSSSGGAADAGGYGHGGRGLYDDYDSDDVEGLSYMKPSRPRGL